MLKRKVFVIAIVSVLGIASAGAQDSVAFIDSQKILEAVPSYVSAKTEIDNLAKTYQQTIQDELSKIETIYNNYQAAKASLTSAQRASMENQIISKENAVQQKQQLYFGEDGVIPKKSEQLLDPIRKKLDAAIESVGKTYGYTMIIDVANASNVAYYNEAKDISQVIINILNN